MAARSTKALYSRRDHTRELATSHNYKEPYRSEFRHDYARLIHSSAFRRLAGKTQLFPGVESDFFRNRLTHSVEVAQIAKSIALKLNRESLLFRSMPINTDLVEMAALAHDLGHPPFGHNGEMALDVCMRQFGGFEGNAQTLRILARLEKKVTDESDNCGIARNGKDRRFGLNLTARSLAAVLKYDRQIPLKRSKRDYKGPKKGYYASEAELVRSIKRSVLGSQTGGPNFKTVECWIMDVADDIAYSTYDLEDAFHAGFLSPIDMVTAKDDELDRVVQEVRMRSKIRMTRSRMRAILFDVFFPLLEGEEFTEDWRATQVDFFDFAAQFAARQGAARDVQRKGYVRTRLTSQLVGYFIDAVSVVEAPHMPALSVVELQPKVREYVEVLKRYAYVSQIMSPRLRIAELRGKEIVTDIFNKLASKAGHELLPDDYRQWYERSRGKAAKMRVICDFIAGMTDRYAVEFYGRLHAETPQTIFKPI